MAIIRPSSVSMFEPNEFLHGRRLQLILSYQVLGDCEAKTSTPFEFLAHSAGDIRPFSDVCLGRD